MKNKDISIYKRKSVELNSSSKPKDFKGSIIRLFIELKSYHVLIVMALILAALGSVLAICSPNKLSELTDEISEGLVIDTKNLEMLSDNVNKCLDKDKLSEEIPLILDMDLSIDNVSLIMSSDDISLEDKKNFQDVISIISSGDNTSLIGNLVKLPDSILEKLLPTTSYDDTEISSIDRIQFLRDISVIMDNSTDRKLGDNAKINTNLVIPESIGSVLFEDVEIDGINISSYDQVRFLNIMTSVSDSSELYSKIDTMPDSIRNILEPFMDMKAIKKIVIFLIILYFCSAIFTYIESISMTNVSNKFANKLRKMISSKINKLPLKYFDNHATGDILSRVTNDIDMIAQTMHNSLATLVSSVTLFIGTIIMMFYTNWIMAITAIIASLFGFIFMFMVLSKSQKYFTSRQVELGNLNGHIEEVYSGLNVVKAYNGKSLSDAKFDEYNKKVYDANRKSQFLSGLMMPMMGFIGNFGYVCVCIVGALLVSREIITFGVIVAFITYVRMFTSPLSQISQAMTSLQSTAAASERVFEFLDEEEMSSQENIKKVLKKENVKGRIEFRDVVFKYDGNEKPTIRNFSAKVLPGQKIAIVGPTGAGKTTMVNLLMKFYDIDSGDIKIDGISIKNLTRENVHDLFTMVLQDTWLFNGTLKENIVYNRDDVNDERIEEVCKVVGLDHFIKTMPNGYDSIISDNDSVSSGQRQLLTIARGMIKDSPFLILDEATSNVDTRTEQLVQSAMDKLMEGRTSFIIAHRLSTIKNADLILVMKEGNIIECGNHVQLMNKKGFYAELYNSQFEL